MNAPVIESSIGFGAMALVWLLACASVLCLLVLLRWRRRQQSGSIAALLLRPALQAMTALAAVAAALILIQFSLRLWSVGIAPQILEMLVPIAALGVLVYIPYRWVDILTDEDNAALLRTRGWAVQLRRYRLPARAALLGVFAVMLLEATDFDIQALMVAGGLGGLVAGLALRELLSDFFSGMSLQATPAIRAGDAIRLSDKNIEGTIVDIGFRVTRLMTFERRPLILPNSLITSSVIESLSGIKSRRIQFVIGLRYQDYPVIKAVVDDLRAEIPHRPSMVDQESSLIYFRAFGSYALDIQVRVFTSKTDYREFCLEIEDCLHHVAAIIERHGAEFAFPTSVVSLEGLPAGEKPAVGGSQPL